MISAYEMAVDSGSAQVSERGGRLLTTLSAPREREDTQQSRAEWGTGKCIVRVQVMRDLKDAAPSEPPSSGSGRHTGRLPMPVSSIWPWSTLTPWMAEEMRKRAR